MKIFFVILFCFAFNMAYSSEDCFTKSVLPQTKTPFQDCDKTAEKFVLCTLPKSGTHFWMQLCKKLKIPLHLYHTAALLKHIKDPTKVVVSIRDPRDFFVSLRDFTNTVIANSELKEPGKYSYYLSLSQEDRLIALINRDPRAYWPNEHLLGYFAGATKAMNRPNTLIVRFEDCIASYTSGNQKLQISSIQKALRYFGYDRSDAAVKEAINNIWGDRVKKGTFYKGTSGRWKEEFTPRVTREFKKSWNSYLILWGYENKKNWDA